jgi:hypothetical protein
LPINSGGFLNGKWIPEMGDLWVLEDMENPDVMI